MLTMLTMKRVLTLFPYHSCVRMLVKELVKSLRANRDRVISINIITYK